ncbi:DUF1614 domain-containing protein [Thermococcus argininiproducens]|uniref:DUF1614 domain-containing protein n=1 Tax=Thermococcus argininiproducens TaxID=2866384 RepID=A0A9E7MB63_9EURY|nr:DUF1614 domain-containing protein [Thermococcus argininiproducens]USH00554.1 DUF1614 domain-containing protein [Thermococcus argininiproducens]
MRRYFFLPLTLPFLIFLVLLLPLLFILFASTITIAFQKLGLPLPVAFTLFWAALIGSFVNIPITEIRSYGPIVKVAKVSFFGVTYPVPYVDWGEQKTIVSINVGGALVPLSIVVYEVVRLLILDETFLLTRMIVAILVSAVVSKAFSRPVKGLGIAIPTFIPPLVAVILALSIGAYNKPLIAYTSGTMGVLIGADLLNWDKLKELSAPMVSIGGAGTFDGIFLAGIIAVLLV